MVHKCILNVLLNPLDSSLTSPSNLHLHYVLEYSVSNKVLYGIYLSGILLHKDKCIDVLKVYYIEHRSNTHKAIKVKIQFPHHLRTFSSLYNLFRQIETSFKVNIKINNFSFFSFVVLFLFLVFLEREHWV